MPGLWLKLVDYHCIAGAGADGVAHPVAVAAAADAAADE